MKKQIKYILALAMVVGCLAGCLANTDRNTVITVGYLPDENTIESHIEMFESKHPGVKILTVKWGYDPNTFAEMVEKNTLPGIYETHFTEAQALIDAGYAADITQELKEYNIYNRINDFIMENISRDGKVYFVPRTIYSMGLYINVPLFKEAGLVDESGIPKAPDSFEELRKTAKLIKEKTRKYGFVFPAKDRFGGWNFTTLAWNYGVDFMKKENGKWKAMFDTKECVQALQLIKDMRWEDGTIQAETNIGNDDVCMMLGENEAAMAFAQSVQLDQAVKNGIINPQNIGMAKMPKGPAGRVTMVGGGYYGINPNYSEKQKKLAFEWLMYDKGYLTNSARKKEEIESKYRQKSENNDGIIGLTGMQLWNDSAMNSSFEDEMVRKYSNVNLDCVRSFNNASDVEYRLEEPVCTQELYKILDECIVMVLENKNADCAAVIHEANKKFQENCLDYEK